MANNNSTAEILECSGNIMANDSPLASSIVPEKCVPVITPETCPSDPGLVEQLESSPPVLRVTVINPEASSVAEKVIQNDCEPSRSTYSVTISTEVSSISNCSSAVQVPGSVVSVLNIHASEVFQLGRPLAQTVSTASYSCRFCQQSESMEMLTSPCNCKGTMAYIHVSCLRRWLNQAGRNYCELCMFEFKTIRTRRYSVCRSLQLWIGHPNNRHAFRNNGVVIGLLTVFVFGIIIIVTFGMHHFITEGNRIGIATKWITGVIGFFLATVIIVYCMTVQLFVHDLFGPWYQWWRRCIDVELVFERPMKRAPKPVRRNHTIT